MSDAPRENADSAPAPSEPPDRRTADGGEPSPQPNDVPSIDDVSATGVRAGPGDAGAGGNGGGGPVASLVVGQPYDAPGDLLGVGSSYVADEDREHMRGVIALILLGILTVIVIGAFASLWTGWAADWDVLDKLLTHLVAPIVGLVGAVTGFYYGHQAGQQSGGSRPSAVVRQQPDANPPPNPRPANRPPASNQPAARQPANQPPANAQPATTAQPGTTAQPAATPATDRNPPATTRPDEPILDFDLP